MEDLSEIESIPNEDEWEKEFEGGQRFNLRKIVAFELDDELYGVDIAEVAEIMVMPPIMPLPNVPDFILGLINLRSTVVPVIDLRVRFALNQTPEHEDTRIIVMKEGDMRVGVVVDRMWELLRLSQEAFQPPPLDVAKIDAEYFREVSPVNGRMLIVLDMGKILRETARKN